MSRPINIKCGKCSQTLAVRPEMAGQKVRCPKCQSILTAPQNLAAKQPATSSPASRRTAPTQQSPPQPSSRAMPAAPKAPRDTVQPSAPTVSSPAVPAEPTIVSCTNCGAQMSVKLLEQPATTKCPKCATAIRLPARKPVAKPAPVVVQATVVPASTPSTVQQPAVPQTASAGAFEDPFASVPNAPSAGVDLGQINVPTSSGPASSAATYSNPYSKSAASKGGGNGFLSWIADHKMATVVVAMNLITLLAAIFIPVLWAVCMIQIPIGALVFGALFIPRFHLVDRVSKAVGAQFAGVGAGGLLLLIILGVARGTLRAMRRQARNDDVDFSALLDPTAIGYMIGSALAVIAFLAVFILLWKLFGIVRVTAGVYLFYACIATMAVGFAGIRFGRQQAEFEAFQQQSDERFREFQERAERGFNRPPGYRPGGANVGGRPSAGPQSIGPGEVRVRFMHPPNTDVDTARDEFLQSIGNPNCQTIRQAPTVTEFILQYDGDVQGLADQVSFGRVTMVNSRMRSINVVPGPPRPNR